MKELTQKLLNYGFSEKEAIVYLSVLELGKSIASTISRKTWINRTTIYTILEELKKRWMISEIIQNDIKYYSTTNPENILKNLENKFNSFKEFLPDLLNIDNRYWNKAKIKYFEWLIWLKWAYYEVLDEWYNMNEPFLSIYGKNDGIDEKVEKFFNEEFVKERKKCPTKSLVITTKKSVEEDYFDVKNEDSLYERIYIQNPRLDFADDIMVYGGNKVVIFMFNKNEIWAIIIESQSLHNTIKSLFYIIWDNLKK